MSDNGLLKFHKTYVRKVKFYKRGHHFKLWYAKKTAHMAATAYPSQPKKSTTAANRRTALVNSIWTNQQIGRDIYGAVIAPANEKRNSFAL